MFSKISMAVASSDNVVPPAINPVLGQNNAETNACSLGHIQFQILHPD